MVGASRFERQIVEEDNFQNYGGKDHSIIKNLENEYISRPCISGYLGITNGVLSKLSKMIIENNKRDLQYYSHLFSQHCCNYKQEWLKTKKSKKSKNAQPRLELAPFERPIVV